MYVTVYYIFMYHPCCLQHSKISIVINCDKEIKMLALASLIYKMQHNNHCFEICNWFNLNILNVAKNLYRNTLLGRVQPEVQKVQISSTEDKETLRFTLTDMSTRTATKEVQQVDMTYSNVDGQWKLALMGVYTGELHDSCLKNCYILKLILVINHRDR